MGDSVSGFWGGRVSNDSPPRPDELANPDEVGETELSYLAGRVPAPRKFSAVQRRTRAERPTTPRARLSWLWPNRKQRFDRARVEVHALHPIMVVEHQERRIGIRVRELSVKGAHIALDEPGQLRRARYEAG